MAQIIHVDFNARAVVEVQSDEPTDEVSIAIAELLREVEAEPEPQPARGRQPGMADARCPVCQSTTCAVWREVRGPQLSLVT